MTNQDLAETGKKLKAAGTALMLGGCLLLTLLPFALMMVALVCGVLADLFGAH